MKKHLSMLMLLAALLVPWASKAQSLADYTLQTGTETYTSIANADSLLGSVTGDAGTQVVNLPFFFPFGEDTYNSVTVRADGYLYFGTASPGHSSKTAWTSTTNYSLIAPLITYDGKITASGATSGAYKAYMADADNNMMVVIEFKSVMCYYSDYGNYNYQVRLYPNGNISVVYGANTATTNISMVHNFFLINGVDDKICLTGSFASPSTSSTLSDLPSLATMPANGKVITYVRPVVTCPKPTFISAITETDQITFYWPHGGSETDWELMVDSVSYFPTDTFYTLTGLTPSTQYVASVRSICGSSEGDTSGWRTGSFRTTCSLISNLPYSYGFEDMATGTSSAHPDIPCWNHLNNGTSYFGYPYVSSTTPHGGTRNLYWYGSTTTGTYGDYQIVVLPGLDTDVYALNTLQLRFWARPSSTSYYPVFVVGVMTDPDDANTFTAVETVNVSNVTDWQEFTVSFDEYTGYGNYIAVRMNRPSSSYYAYTDDFTIETIPACPSIDEITVVPSVGAALITWTMRDDATGSPDSYTVTYDSVGSTGTPLTISTSEPVATLTGLTAGTSYKAFISAECGTDGSGRADSIVFSTASLECLTLDPTILDTTIFSNSTSGTSGCLAYSGWGNTAYQAIWTAAELTAAGMTAGPITGIDLGFTACTSYNKEFTIFIGTTTTSSISDATMENPNQQTQVYGPSLHPMNTSGWQHYNFTTPFSWDGASNIIITTFMNQSGGSQSNSTGLTGYYVSASNKARYRYKDSNPFTLSDYNSGTAGSSYNYRASIHFYQAGCLVQASCAAPSVAVSDVQSDEVTISWVPGYDETSWDVDYRIAGSTTWTSVATGTSDNSYTITSLTPATEYEFRVGFSCSDGTDYYTTVSAMTVCVPQVLPYSENFDNITTSTSTSNYGVMPSCWDYSLTATSSTYLTGSYLPGVYYSSTNANSGSYSMRLAGMGYFKLPEMAASIDSLLISFNTYITSSSYGLIVGVMEGNTFVPVDTVEMAVSQHTPYEVSFANYTGTGNRIAFRNTYGTNNTYSYVYIDDIVVDYIPACPRVNGVTVSTILADGATIHWNDVNGSTYEIEYGPSGYPVGQGITVTATGDSVVLTGLNASTPYDVYVREVCSEGTAVWSFVRSFRTACAAISQMPYSNDFETEPAYSTVAYAQAFPACWTRINDATGTSNYYPYITTTANYVHSGTNGMYWYQSTSSGYAQNEYAVLPPIDLNAYDISDLILSFYGKTTSTSYHPQPVVGVMTDPTDTSTFTPVYTFTASQFTTSWQQFIVPLTSYTGTGAYIAIKWHNPGSSWYMAIDDIYLTDEWCDAPLAVEATSTTDEITIHWTPGTATSFTVTLGFDTVNNVTDTFYTFTNLTGNTLYNYSVMSECSGTTSMPLNGSIRTQCDAMTTLPYTQNFDAAATGGSTSTTWVDCMGRLNNGTQYFGYPYVGGSTYNHTTGGSKGLYWYNTTTTGTYGDYQIVVLPGVDTTVYPINTLQLTFWARPSTTSYSPQFQVGVMTDPNVASTFQVVQTVNVMNVTDWQEFTVMLTHYTGQGQYVAIRALRPSSSWYAYVDDITLDQIPSCPPVRDLTVATTAGAAVLTWDIQDGYNEPSGYEVSYRAMTPGATNTVVNTTNPYYVISGLTTGTTYKAVVRADCDNDGLGRADSVTFTPQVNTYIQVGEGTSTSYELPVNNYYNYSYTQELILASEMNGPATLTGIDFQYAYSSASTAKTNVQIYLATVTQSSLTSAVPYSASTFQQVYSGNLNCTQGWNHFQFTTPYNYNGTGNLLVVVNDNSGDYDGNSYVFNTHSASNMSQYAYNDDDAYTLSSAHTETDVLSVRANMRLNFSGSANTCVAPRVLAVNVSFDEVTLAWAPGNDETSWDVEYRTSTDTAWTTAATGVSVNSYTITGLNPATDYDFRVTYECGDGSTVMGAAHATTICVPAALPYTENFDSITTSTTSNYGLMPNCWDYTITATSSTYQTGSYLPGVYYSSANANSGNYSMRLAGMGYFMLPEMAASIDSLLLSFNAYITSSSYGLIVGVMEGNTFVPVDTITMAVSQHNNAEVSFASYTGTGNRIAFRNTYGTNNTYSYVYIDDIVVDYIPACPRVTNVTARNIGQTTATIVWADGTSNYEIEYGPTGFNHGQGTMVTSYGADSVDISGLTPNTPYDVYVREICNEGSTVWSFVYTFRTDCVLIDSLPYVENFEGYVTGSSSTTSPFIPCWTRLNNGTSYGGYPYLSNSATYNHTDGGGAGLYWYNTTTTGTYGDYMYIILPEIDTTVLDISTMQLTFWARSSSTSYYPTFEVGVMTDNTDTAFESIATINVGNNTEWTEFTTGLSTHVGPGRYVAIRTLRATSSWYAYVDDVTLESLPSCPRVEDLHAIDVMLDTIIVAWTDTSSNTGWNVEYDTVEFTPGTGHMTAIHVTDTFCVIPGLDSATRYHIYVYPDCGTDIYDRHIAVTTLAAAPALTPYFCDFEATGVNGWDLLVDGQTNYWIVGNATNNGGSRSLYVTNDGSSNSYTNTTISYSYAVRTLRLVDSGEYAYAYDWKGQGESHNYDFTRVFLTPAGEQFEAGQILGGGTYAFASAACPATWYDLTQSGATPNTLAQQTNWQSVNGTIHISTPGNYKLVFVWANDGSGGTNPPTAIDNVGFIHNTCPMPQNVTAAISADSISLTWTPGGSETEWEVSLGTTSVVVTTPSHTFAGLNANSDYTVYIRSICGVGDTSLVYSESYHTPCVATSLPFSENFDALTTGTATSNLTVVPSCWDYILTGSSSYQTASYYPGVYYSSSNAHSGSYSYRLYGEGYHMLPPMPTSLDSLELTFWDYTTSTSYGLEVGVMEGNTFVPVQTISTPTSTHLQHTVYFGNYTGTSRIIAFHNYYTTSTTSNYSYHYIDDVHVDYLPTCPTVQNVHAVGAGVGNIVVDWTDLATATSWEVRYSHGSTTPTVVTTSVHPVNITGLDTLTSYTFEVRPICSATDMGDWSTSVSLSTEPCDNANAATTGNATSTSYYVPVNNYYKYTLSETIIDSAELVGIGEISAIAYSYAYATASTDKTDVTIWLQPTTKTVFSSTTDIVLLDTTIAVQVYTGNLNCSQGWNYFQFSAPYLWDGHSNLLVIVDDNSNDYNSSSYTFNSSSCNGYKTLVWYSDSYNPDPTSTSYSGTKTYYQYRPTMKLVSCGGCATPHANVTDITYESATITVAGNGESYELQYGTDINNLGNTMTSTTNVFNLTGLQPATQYFFQVRQNCGDNEMSGWGTGAFTTDSLPCMAVSNLALVGTTFNSISVSWTANGDETAWEVNVFSTLDDTTVTVSTTAATVGGLVSERLYNISVRPMCGSNHNIEGPWSDTIQATTDQCQPVTNLTVSNIGATMATIGWTAPAGAEHFRVIYGLPNFDQGGELGTYNTESNPFVLTELEANSDYTVRVANVCAENLVSQWTSADFTTVNVGINGVEFDGSLSLYPNPASTMVTLSVSEQMAGSTVSIVDVNGRVVMSEVLNAQTLTMNLSDMAKGAYFVRITGEETTVVRKLIVE